MAKFIYGMQNILNIKYKLEEQAKNAYATQKRKYEEECRVLESYQELKIQYETQLKRQVNNKLVIRDIRIIQQAILGLQDKIEKQKIVVKRVLERVEHAQNLLNEAMIERKTHEKLRENAFEVFVQEIADSERKEIDELVSFKYNGNDEVDRNGEEG